MNKQLVIIPVCAILLTAIQYIHKRKQEPKPQTTESIFNVVQALDTTIYKAQTDLQKTIAKHKHALHNKTALLTALCVIKAGKTPQKLPETEGLVFTRIQNHLKMIALFGSDKDSEIKQLANRAAQRYLSFAHDHIKFNDTGDPLNSIHFMRRGMYYSADYPKEPKKNIWKKLTPAHKKSA